jgi:hypothetical protein
MSSSSSSTPSTPSPKATVSTTTPPPAPRKRKKQDAQQQDIPVRCAEAVPRIYIVTYVLEDADERMEVVGTYYLSKEECQKYDIATSRNPGTTTDFDKDTQEARDVQCFLEDHDEARAGCFEILGFGCVQVGYSD